MQFKNGQILQETLFKIGQQVHGKILSFISH